MTSAGVLAALFRRRSRSEASDGGRMKMCTAIGNQPAHLRGALPVDFEQDVVPVAICA